MDVDKYTYIKIVHLKLKSVIIVEIRDISIHIVEKNPEKIIRNLICGLLYKNRKRIYNDKKKS